MLARKSVLMLGIESNYGVDALLGLTEDARKRQALAVTELNPQETWDQIDDPVYGGSLSRDVTAVGASTAQHGFRLQMRGSGSASLVPEFARPLEAGMFARKAARKLPLTGVQHDTVGDGTGYVSGGSFIAGEQVFGPNTLTSSSWDSVAGNGDGLGTAPSVGDAVTAYPVGSDEDQAPFSGTVRSISGTTILIRPGGSTTARIGSGWMIKAPAGYMDVTDDTPVLIVADLEHNAVAFTGNLWGYEVQGTFATADVVVGQANGVQATCGTVTTEGYVWHPESKELIRFPVGAWSGSAPVAGEELIRQNAPGQWRAAAKVVEVDGSDITVQVYYGTFNSGDTVFVATTASSATLSGGPTQVAGKSATAWVYRDGWLRRATGCRLNWTIELAAGNPANISFDLSGRPAGRDSQVHPEGISFPNTVAPRWAGSKADFLGIPLRTLSASITPGNTIEREQDANASDGTVGFSVGDRDPAVQFVVQRPGYAGWQIENAIQFGSWRTAGFKLGTGAGQVIAIACPRLQLISAQDGEEGGRLTAQVEARLRQIQGDDELVIHTR